jgi:hypothetical protein
LFELYEQFGRAFFSASQSPVGQTSMNLPASQVPQASSALEAGSLQALAGQAMQASAVEFVASEYEPGAHGIAVCMPVLGQIYPAPQLFLVVTLEHTYPTGQLTPAALSANVRAGQ